MAAPCGTPGSVALLGTGARGPRRVGRRDRPAQIARPDTPHHDVAARAAAERVGEGAQPEEVRADAVRCWGQIVLARTPQATGRSSTAGRRGAGEGLCMRPSWPVGALWARALEKPTASMAQCPRPRGVPPTLAAPPAPPSLNRRRSRSRDRPSGRKVSRSRSADRRPLPSSSYYASDPPAAPASGRGDRGRSPPPSTRDGRDMPLPPPPLDAYER
jgi:hypothetical protein